MMGMKQFIHSYLSSLTFTYSDVLEIIILSFIVYHILIWIRNTRAWTLMKGILVMIVFIFIALNNPQASFPWSNAITYILYGVYALIMIVLFIAPFKRKK